MKKKVLLFIPCRSDQVPVQIANFIAQVYKVLPDWIDLDVEFTIWMLTDRARNEWMKIFLEWERERIISCFMAWTLVETKKWQKKIENIKVWEYVKTHTWEYKKVLTTHKRWYNRWKPVIQIETEYTITRCTPEHPIYTGEWFKEARYLSNKDYLYYPYKHKQDILYFWVHWWNQFKDLTWKYFWWDINIDRDLARFMWLYLAEWCWWNWALRFTLNNNAKEDIELIKKISNEVFLRKPTIYTRRATQVNINIRDLQRQFIEWFWDRATNKRIPSFVYSWNLINKLEFLKWYLNWDWHFSKKSMCYTFSSANELLVNDINKLANSCWIQTTKSKHQIKEKSNKLKDYNREIWPWEYRSWRINRQQSWKLLNLLNWKIELEYIKIPIKNVKNTSQSTRKDNNVYNLEVEDNNTYIVNEFIVHNCDDDNPTNPELIQQFIEDDKDVVIWTIPSRLPDKTWNHIIAVCDRTIDKYWLPRYHPKYKLNKEDKLQQVANWWSWVFCAKRHVIKEMSERYNWILFKFDSEHYAIYNEWLPNQKVEKFYIADTDPRTLWCSHIVEYFIAEDMYFFGNVWKCWFEVWRDPKIKWIHLSNRNIIKLDWTFYNWPEISVIIPTYNSVFWIKHCVDEVKAKFTIPYEIIIVDDWSQDSTHEYLDLLKWDPNIKIVRHKENEWVTKSWNDWIKEATWNVICVLNNDITFEKWIDKLLYDELKKYETQYEWKPHIVCPVYTEWVWEYKWEQKYKEDNIGGMFWMMNKKDFEKIWPIDERLKIWFNDDWVFNRLVHDFKWWVIWARLPIHHYWSKTVDDPNNKDKVRWLIKQDQITWQEILKEKGWSDFRFNIKKWIIEK